MEKYEVAPLPGYVDVIGCWLWAMQETRAQTLRLLQHEALDQSLLDWGGPEGDENTIGSLLYHIAEVKMGWLWGNIKGLLEMPPKTQEFFPFESEYEETGRITNVLGVPLSEHIARLERSREIFLCEARSIPGPEWQALQPDPLDSSYEASPEWILYHLIEHEMEHNEQISAVLTRATPAG